VYSVASECCLKMSLFIPETCQTPRSGQNKIERVAAGKRQMDYYSHWEHNSMPRFRTQRHATIRTAVTQNTTACHSKNYSSPSCYETLDPHCGVATNSIFWTNMLCQPLNSFQCFGSVSSPLCVWELERVCSQTQLCQLRCLMTVLDNYMFRPLLAIVRLSLRELKVLLYDVRACDGEISTSGLRNS
jgi:hypothetical protein